MKQQIALFKKTAFTTRDGENGKLEFKLEVRRTDDKIETLMFLKDCEGERYHFTGIITRRKTTIKKVLAQYKEEGWYETEEEAEEKKDLVKQD